MENLITGKKLPLSFYKKDVLTVARGLLGKIFVRVDGRTKYAGRIVEVEAYNGENDEAAHTFIGKTDRNKIMFEEGGYLYVYFTYGAHFCSNVVTGEKGKGTAVLIRAVEPLAGLRKMSLNRFGKEIITSREKLNLTSGPGKLCRAFNITRSLYAESLRGNAVFILDAPTVPDDHIISAKRIGIKKSIDLPWRFYIKENPYVSRK